MHQVVRAGSVSSLGVSIGRSRGDGETRGKVADHVAGTEVRDDVPASRGERQVLEATGVVTVLEEPEADRARQDDLLAAPGTGGGRPGRRKGD